MKILPTSEIIISEGRWRKEFKEAFVKDLAKSIETVGLIHAPLCRVVDGKHILVAGETRIAAMTSLHDRGVSFRYEDTMIEKDHIPVICTSELSANLAKEAELEENIKRKKLTWKEEAYAVAELHAIYNDRAIARGEKSTYTRTAEEVFSDGDGFPIPSSKLIRVRDDLLLNTYADDPEISKAKTRDDAIKMLRKKLDREHREHLSREFQTSEIKSQHTLIKGNMLEIMPKLDAGKYDCIICDPPYGVNANMWNNQSAVKHKYKDSEDYANEIMVSLANEGHRITKLRAHAYIFCDITRFEIVKSIFEANEWYVWKWPLIWYRGENSGILPRPDHGPRRTYEAIMYGIKNDRKVQKVGAIDVILNSPHKRELQYGAQKPPALYEDLISRSCLAGNLVIDPCCGTGPIFPAAERTNTLATGIELDDEGYGYSYARIKEIESLEPEKDEV